MTGDFYQPREGWLHRLDPRSCLLMSLILMVAPFLLPGLGEMMIALLLIHLLLISASIPFKTLFRLWKILIPLMLLIILLWPLFSIEGNTVIWEWRRIRITLESLELGVMTALRLPVLLLAGYIPLLTHRQNRLIRGWVSLGVPYRIGLIIMLSLRFLPFFRESYHQIEQAQQMRGLKLKKAGLKGRLPVFVSLIVWALRTSGDISMALETRGLGYSKKPSFLTELKFKWFDWVILLLSATMLAGLIIAF